MNRIYSGIVVATNPKDTKTVNVEITSLYRHQKYQKVIKRRKKIKVHNKESLLLHVGEEVIIKADRPYSKTKRFLLIRKVNA